MHSRDRRPPIAQPSVAQQVPSTCERGDSNSQGLPHQILSLSTTPAGPPSLDRTAGRDPAQHQPAPPDSAGSTTDPATCLRDTPASHLRNALQIFYGANMGTAAAPLFALTEAEQHDVFRRVVLALVEIETQRTRRREILRQTIRRRTDTLAADLQEIERTNRELAGDPSVLLEASGA